MASDEPGVIVLPSDPFWFLNNVRVKEGECTPFTVQMLYAYQWRFGSFAPDPDSLLAEDNIYTQADGER